MTTTLWTLADLAAFLQVSETQASRIASADGFPRPIILPSHGRGERQIKRWIPAHVDGWVESQAKIV